MFIAPMEDSSLFVMEVVFIEISTIALVEGRVCDLRRSSGGGGGSFPPYCTRLA